MEEHMVKFFSQESNKLAMHVIPGHFATSNSHINYYIDVNSMKARVNEAKEAARILSGKVNMSSYVDTIVCVDGTEVIGAFLASELESQRIMTTNQHETLYVVSPEMNNGQMIFRDNMKAKIAGKYIIVLLDTTTTGETIRRSLECIRYYGGNVEGVFCIFSTLKSLDGIQVERIFTERDIPGYHTYAPGNCPFCAKGIPIQAMVNGYGYSKL